MALLVSSFITDLRRILLDPTPGVTWDDPFFIKAISRGERAICAVKHEAYPVRAAIALAAGVEQALPAGDLCLLDLYQNTTSGRRVRLVDRSLQDASAPFFPIATQEVDVQEYTKDDRDPTRFTVLPPNDGTGSVMGLVGRIPAALAATSDAIHLNDTYEEALQAFVLAAAYAENTIRQDVGKVGFYTTKWQQLVGVSTQSQVAASPKVVAVGGTA